MPLLLSRLCGCLAPAPEHRGEEEQARAAARAQVSTSPHSATTPAVCPGANCPSTSAVPASFPNFFLQAPVQPDSPPVKARALPDQGVPAVSLHASASVAPHSNRLADAAFEQEEEPQLSEQRDQQQQGPQPGEASAGLAPTATPDELAAPQGEGSEPDALSLLPMGEPPLVGQDLLAPGRIHVVGNTGGLHADPLWLQS